MEKRPLNAITSPREQPENDKQSDRNLEGTDQQPNQETIDDPSKQEQYRQEYLRQLRLRSCPGCGETGLF